MPTQTQLHEPSQAELEALLRESEEGYAKHQDALTRLADAHRRMDELAGAPRG